MRKIRFESILWGLLGSAALLYALLNPLYRTGMVNDDAVYVLGARRLWHPSGFSSLILRPDYPMPGLPILLAPWIPLIEPHWTRLETLLILVTLATVFSLATWTRKFLSVRETLIVTALFAFSPIVTKFSGIVMPSIPFALAAIVSFLWISDCWEQLTPWKALGVGFMLGWGNALRPEGFLLLIGAAVPLLGTRKGWAISRFAAIPVIAWWGAVWGWHHLCGNVGSEFQGDITALVRYWSGHLVPGFEFFSRFIQTLFIGPLTTLKIPHTPGVLLFLGLLTAIALGMIAIGFHDLWKKQAVPRPVLLGLVVFCGSYLVVHVFWHVATGRYTIPLLPFVLIFLVHGTRLGLAQVPHRKLWATAILLLLFGAYARKQGTRLEEAFEGPNPMKGPPWESIEWLNTHTPADIKVMSAIAPAVELYANRPSLPGLQANNVEMFLYRFHQRGLAYIVDRYALFLTPGVGDADDPNRFWERMRYRMALHPQQFKPVYENREELTRIYEVVLEKGFLPAYELLRTAHQAYQEGRMEEALRLVTQSLATNPQLGSAWNLQGAIHWRLHHLAAAEQAFLKSIDHLPTSNYAMINLASLYQQEGQPQKSEVYIQRAKTVSEFRGDRDDMDTRLQNLYTLWAKKRSLIFLDAP